MRGLQRAGTSRRPVKSADAKAQECSGHSAGAGPRSLNELGVPSPPALIKGYIPHFLNTNFKKKPTILSTAESS